MKNLYKTIISILSIVLIFSILTYSPANAKQQAPTDEEIEKAKLFAAESLIVNDNGTYTINKESALEIYSQVEIENIEKTFNQLDKQTIAGLKAQFGQNQDITPFFAPAIPIVAMSVWELLAWLGTIGASSLAAAFAKDLYKHGAVSACKKYANKNKYLKSWCESNDYL